MNNIHQVAAEVRKISSRLDAIEEGHAELNAELQELAARIGDAVEADLAKLAETVDGVREREGISEEELEARAAIADLYGE